VIFAAAPVAGTGEVRGGWTVNDISVVQIAPGEERGANTRFEIGHEGDARISVSLRDSAHTRGTILLIGGRWMLAQGFAPTPGREIEAMDLAALNSQLVIVLLTAALPKGPPPPGAPQHVLLTERNNPIRIVTETASAEYSPPWTIDGTVSVPGEGAPASFRLSFTWSAQGHPTTRVFTGSVGNTKPALSIPDSMKLTGWSVHEIGRRAADRSPQKSTTAHAAAAHVVTVGELRSLP
jgi:hypothetical protein